MTFEEYKGKIVKAVQEKCPDIEVSLVPTKKVNTVLTGLTMKHPDSNVAPIIYLEDIFVKIGSHEMNDEMVKRVAEDIVLTYKRSGRISPDAKELTRIFSDYSVVKDYVKPMLINPAWNKGLLEELVSSEWLDLAVVYQIEYKDLVAKVSKKHIESWGVTAEQIVEDAMRNLENSEPLIQNMIEALKDTLLVDTNDSYTLGYTMEEVAERVEAAWILGKHEDENEMYVVSSQDKHNGARTGMQPSVLAELAERLGGDLVFVMSSIHEILVMRADRIDLETLKSMVYQINRTELSKQEVLSDNVYLYSKSSGFIGIASEESLIEQGVSTYVNNDFGDEEFDGVEVDETGMADFEKFLNIENTKCEHLKKISIEVEKELTEEGLVKQGKVNLMAVVFRVTEKLKVNNLCKTCEKVDCNYRRN